MSYSIQYSVPLIPQTYNMSCWAASIAMIDSWKRKSSYLDDNMVAKYGGVKYRLALKEGLSPTDKRILHRFGFETIPNNKSINVDFLIDLLHRKGPIWVARWAPGPHISVITGNSGDTFFMNDPSPVNEGSQFPISHSNMRQKIESLYVGGKGHSKEPDNSVYFAYLK